MSSRRTTTARWRRSTVALRDREQLNDRDTSCRRSCERWSGVPVSAAFAYAAARRQRCHHHVTPRTHSRSCNAPCAKPRPPHDRCRVRRLRGRHGADSYHPSGRHTDTRRVPVTTRGHAARARAPAPPSFRRIRQAHPDTSAPPDTTISQLALPTRQRHPPRSLTDRPSIDTDAPPRDTHSRRRASHRGPAASRPPVAATNANGARRSERRRRNARGRRSTSRKTSSTTGGDSSASGTMTSTSTVQQRPRPMNLRVLSNKDDNVGRAVHQQRQRVRNRMDAGNATSSGPRRHVDDKPRSGRDSGRSPVDSSDHKTTWRAVRDRLRSTTRWLQIPRAHRPQHRP